MKVPFLLLGLPFSGLQLMQGSLAACGINFGTTQQRDVLRTVITNSLADSGIAFHGLNCRASLAELTKQFNADEFHAAAETIRGENEFWCLAGSRLHLYLHEIIAMYPDARILFHVRHPGVNKAEIMYELGSMGVFVKGEDIEHAQVNYMALAHRACSDLKHTRVSCFENHLQDPRRIVQVFNHEAQGDAYGGLCVSEEQETAVFENVLLMAEKYIESNNASRPSSVRLIEQHYFALQQKSI